MDQVKLPNSFVPPHELAKYDLSASVLLGFSGGADSSALLHMLSVYSKKTGCKLYAAHINHGIRGAEADRDEAFCKETAEKYGVEIFVLNADVPHIAKETGESIETAARRVRYGFFEKIMKEHGITLLATAHNANDNLETVIFNLSRGAGLDGLCGIPQTRDIRGGCIVRPILKMSREEILEYCNKNSLSFVTDSTNTDTDYTRNKIRAEIIPSLLSINASAIKNVTRAKSNLCADAQYLWQEADRFLKENLKNGRISSEILQKTPEPIFNRVIMQMYSGSSMGATLDSVHLKSIKKLVFKAEAHSSIDLPNSIEAVIEDGLLFRKKAEAVQIEPYDLELSLGNNYISQTNCEIVIGNSQKEINIYKKSILLYIDFDKIEGALKIRNRLAGDRILENGMHKSVKKLACDRKVPLELRSRIPIIYDNAGIVAIPFVAVRDGVKVSESKKNAIPLQFYLY
jgi:tRNA(Ile)-lysidine synthase